MTGFSYIATFSERISDIGRNAWDACAGTGNPFSCYDFLEALEASGCATAETGWQPYHVSIQHEQSGEIVAVMPLYIKGHSYGEYVFDHAWADAYQRAGGQYYPKLQSSIPFTPATGTRLLSRSTDPETSAEHASALLTAVINMADKLGISSFHSTFLSSSDVTAAKEASLLIRTDQQFHWQNREYESFDAFLATLASRKRKQIRKERRTVSDAGVHIQALTGEGIPEAHWDFFFACYLDTGRRKWGQPYLNREFFSEIASRMADRVLMIHCEHEGHPVASALNFIGDDTLYGRYWGCMQDLPCLHFEACYYQAIDFAIAHKLGRVEAGAQGQHKLARGYEPTKTFSAHFIRDPGFRDAVARFLTVEREQVDADVAYLGEFTPFKKAP